MKVIGPTNHFLTEFEASSTGGNSCQSKGQAWEVIGPMWGETTTDVLLNGHAIKLSSKYLLLCPNISAVLNFGQGRFFNSGHQLMQRLINDQSDYRVNK